MKTHITPNDFIQLLNFVPILSIAKPDLSDYLNRITKIDNRVIDGDVNVDVQYNRKGIEIEDCEFKSINLRDIDLGYGIKFKNCTIDNLVFEKCRSTQNDGYFNVNYNVEFHNCTINNLTLSNCFDFNLGVLISDGTKINRRLQFLRYNSPNSLLSIKNSEILGQLNIIRVNVNNFNVAEGTSISGIFTIENIISNTIRFDKAKIKNALNIFNVKCSYFYFYKGDYESDVDLSGLNIETTLDLQETTFHKYIKISVNNSENKISGNVKHLYINSCKFSQQFQIINDENKVQSIEINFGPQLEGFIYIHKCTIQDFKIKGTNTKGSLEIHDCNLGVLDFDHFSNSSNIILNHIEGISSDKSELKITNSNLGKTQIFNTDFTSFTNVNIAHSNLTEIIISDIRWFEEKRFNIGGASNNNREVYRQLKYALEKQGNKIDALVFKSREMKAYKKEIATSQKNFDDWFILFAGSTNTFGLNPWKAIFLLFVGAYFFYCLIIVGVSPRLDYWPCLTQKSICYTIKQFTDNFDKFPRLLDPTHSLEKLFERTKETSSANCDKEGNYIISFGANWFSYLLKIYLAFFIFQIVKAFRKFAE